MKIRIDIDLQPHKTAELERLAQCAKNLYAAVNAIEEQIENYRERLERLEEMTTRFKGDREKN